ncbi:MAG TPA: TonB-dependent receptor [Patescibacteria group bacterium]|nr:TonB-dependent receptor [Patescibacteria group bacterium]
MRFTTLLAALVFMLPPPAWPRWLAEPTDVAGAAESDEPTEAGKAAPASMLGEVVVTARKKSEVLQDVPMSVAAFETDELVELGVHNLKDLSTQVPGLQQNDLAISSRLTLRGVNSGDNNAFEQSVGTYVDGIYRGRMNQQHIGLFDVERVEVLKGPQVTLYGNSSLGGAISVITQRPGFAFGGDVRMSYGAEYAEPQIEAAIDLPVSDQFALRVAGTWRDQGHGIAANDASGDSEPRSGHDAIRLSGSWLPSDRLSVSMRHEQGRFDREGRIFEVYKHVDGQGDPWPNSPFTGVDDGRLNIGNGAPFKYPEAFLRTDMDESMLELRYQFDAFDVTAISGYGSYDFRHSADVDITPATLINIYQDERFSQFSQELRIAGHWTDRADYLFGAYLQRDDYRNDYLSDFNLPELLAPAYGVSPSLVAGLLAPFSRHILIDQDTDQQALFGSVNVGLDEQWTATFGFRYLDIGKDAQQAVRVAGIDHRDAPGELIDLRWLDPALAPLLLGNADYLANPTGYVLVLADGTVVQPLLAPNNVAGYSIVSQGAGDLHEFDALARDERHPMFHLGLAYQWSDDLLAYVNWSNGAKAGGFDFLYEGDRRDEVEYGDESARVFELGFKKDWRDLRLNLALFHGRYEDLQVSVFDGGIGFLVGNAASSVSKGVDVDLDWRIEEDLRLLARIEYLDFRYDRFADANCSTTERLNTGAAICDWSGDRTPFVPEFEGILRLQHTWRAATDWSIRQALGWNYRGSHATASDNEVQTRQAAYGLFDYRLQLLPATGDWSLALIGSNLTDEKYNVFTSVIPLAPGGAFASVLARGREVSIEMQYHF